MTKVVKYRFETSSIFSPPFPRRFVHRGRQIPARTCHLTRNRLAGRPPATGVFTPVIRVAPFAGSTFCHFCGLASHVCWQVVAHELLGVHVYFTGKPNVMLIEFAPNIWIYMVSTRLLRSGSCGATHDQMGGETKLVCRDRGPMLFSLGPAVPIPLRCVCPKVSFWWWDCPTPWNTYIGNNLLIKRHRSWQFFS